MWRTLPLWLTKDRCYLRLSILYGDLRKFFLFLPPFFSHQPCTLLHHQFPVTTAHSNGCFWIRTHFAPSLRGKGTYQTRQHRTDKLARETHGLSPVLSSLMLFLPSMSPRSRDSTSGDCQYLILNWGFWTGPHHKEQWKKRCCLWLRNGSVSLYMGTVESQPEPLIDHLRGECWVSCRGQVNAIPPEWLEGVEPGSIPPRPHLRADSQGGRISIWRALLLEAFCKPRTGVSSLFHFSFVMR